ncbi:alpha/beta hydrolase [Romboutsia weinsteinii]|uniref:Alpha/beta hydrolase n=1 Tax=Romboutsia weinsteinii TaxID=2020949 RepID=A0A371J1I3_9FIRM|nr:alpha/beta fold hydrolase [Romboutsia weinsteinii]RDY26563.1 alpha/beta hydrolase [Romboutsia weinsteinii]
MEFVQGFVNNQGVKIHYIDNDLMNTNTTPLLICPGLSESAEDYVNLMSRINNRRCVAFSFRGRGKSGSPKSGYTLEQHIKDIDSVAKGLGFDKFCIMGISRGVSYELGYAVSNSESLKGIIVDEYPPEHKKMPNGWAKESMDFYDEHCDSISITYDVLKGIEDESEQIYFAKKLENITCPALILKGELEESLVSSDDIVNYVDNLGSKSIRVEKFKKAGHDIQFGDFEGLVKVMNEYLKSID